MIQLNSLSNNLKSFTYTNINTDGNFTSTTGWSGAGMTLAVANNILSVTGDGSRVDCRFWKTIAMGSNPASKKIYVACKCKVTNAACTQIYLRLASNTSLTKQAAVKIQNSPVNGVQYDLSGVASLPADWDTTNIVTYNMHVYADNATQNGKVMEVKELLIVDLTALFGAGKEPLAADCANIFKFVDGTKQPSLSNVLAT